MKSFLLAATIALTLTTPSFAEVVPASQIIASQIGNLFLQNATQIEQIAKLMEQVEALQKQVEQLKAAAEKK